MGLHKPFDRTFVLNAGSVMTNGYSLKLAKGQLGIFDITKTTADGMKAVANFNGRPKSTKYEIKLGKSNNPVTRSHNNKSMSSFPFSVEDVIDVKVSAPDTDEQKVDEVVAGYNGIDDSTAIRFNKGDRKKLMVKLSGEPIGLLGYTNSFVNIPVYMEADNCKPYDQCTNCDPCDNVDTLPIVKEAIETLKRHKLRGGVTVDNFIDVSIVKSCTTPPVLSLKPYKFHVLEVCDTGDQNALALVQAQYPNYVISRVDRKGATSVYKLLAPSTDTIQPYTQTIASIIKGCDTCPSGYTEVPGGYIYAVTLEDDGNDMTTNVQAMVGAVAGTAIKLDTQDNGVGYYTVVLTAKLGDTDFNSFLTANPTATITLAAKTDSICDNGTQTTINWVDGDVCNTTTQDYIIDLPDTDCGSDRLSELQEAYPSLNVVLEGTTGGCKTRYKATVETNLVCDECDAIFKDYFKSEAPAQFEGNEWKAIGSLDGTDCKVGIRLKGKVMEVHPGECLIEDLGFADSSVKIEVSGGYLTEVRAGEETVSNDIHVEYKSRAANRTHLGGNLYQFEEKSFTYFTGNRRHEDSLVARMLLGEEHILETGKQYVDYAVTIKRGIFSQGFASTQEDFVTYHILAEVGRHQDVEALVNMLASEAGLPVVKAYGN